MLCLLITLFFKRRFGGLLCPWIGCYRSLRNHSFAKSSEVKSLKSLNSAIGASWVKLSPWSLYLGTRPSRSEAMFLRSTSVRCGIRPSLSAMSFSRRRMWASNNVSSSVLLMLQYTPKTAICQGLQATFLKLVCLTTRRGGQPAPDDVKGFFSWKMGDASPRTNGVLP